MALFNLTSTKKTVTSINEKLRKFIVGPDDDEIISRVKAYTNYASYATDIWGDSSSMQTLGLLREVPAMLKDPVIQSALGVLMETSFQMNDKNEVLWVISPFDSIKKELKEFHDQVNMQQQAVTLAYNLLCWGNLPYKHYFDQDGRFVNFTPIPDFTQVVPIVVSGKTLGYLVGGQFCFPYEFSYGQLEFFKNLGGIYKSNFVQFSGNAGGTDVFGKDFQNEFIVSPSYLATAAKAWRNINIIEDALLLNRMDQSNYYRIISVKVGGSVYSKSAIRTLNYYRNLFKKVRRVSYDAKGMNSISAGQDYEVILPETEKQGINVNDVGGSVEVRAIKDLETMYSKLFSALKIQPSQIGFGEEQSNAIGDTNGASYDRRLARTCKMLVYSVQKVIKNFDYLYLRSRGYDVTMDDWKYGTVSLSVLEDQDRAETLATAIENLKAVADVFKSLGLEEFNRNYLAETVLGPSLSATGVDIKEVLKVPEGQEGEVPDKEPVQSSLAYKNECLNGMLDVMERTNLASTDFIMSARASLVQQESLTLIASAKAINNIVSYQSLDDGNAYMLPEDTQVDLSGAVRYMRGDADQIISDFDRVKSKNVEEMTPIDFNSTILIPSGMAFTIADFNQAGIRALGRGYLNSRGEIVLVDKPDVVTYLHMKRSGLLSCLVSQLYQIP